MVCECRIVDIREAIEGCATMKILSRIASGLLLAMSVWPAFAADFYWNCTTPIGTRYADATRCDTGDVGVKVMKTGPAPAAVSESAGSGAHKAATPARNPPAENPAGVCPKDPAVCQLPDYGVTAEAPREHAIARFLRQKECEFLQRLPNRCVRPQ